MQEFSFQVRSEIARSIACLGKKGRFSDPSKLYIIVDCQKDVSVLVATDGVRLIAFNEVGPEGMAGQGAFVFPAAQLIKLMREQRKTATVAVKPDAGTVVYESHGISVTVQIDEKKAAYATWRKCVTRTPSGEPAQFNPYLMSAFVDICDVLSGGKRFVPFVYYNGEKAAVVDVHYQGAIGLIMPVFVEPSIVLHDKGKLVTVDWTQSVQ